MNSNKKQIGLIVILAVIIVVIAAFVASNELGLVFGIHQSDGMLIINAG